MKLPLVDEIREARRLSEEAQQAAIDAHRVDAALTSVSITEKQVNLRPDLAADLPAWEVIEQLSERWPQLSDLASHAIPRTQPMVNQLAARRGQLELARQVLRPLAREGTERARRLLELQQAQRHALEDAEWSDQIAELSDLGLERDRLATEMAPLDSRLAMVDPAVAMLDVFVRRLDAERPAEDPLGLFTWRLGHLARAFVDSFRTVLFHLKLEVPVPDAPPVPSAPDPDPALREALLAEVQHVRQLLAELREILTQEGAALREDRDRRKARHEQLTRQILERMG